MRYTYGTIAAMTCSILVLATFWPHADGPAIQTVVAQSDEKEIADVQSSDPFDGSRERIEEILAQPYPGEWFTVPFGEVLKDIAVNKGVAIEIDPKVADEIDLEEPLVLATGPDSMSLKTMLEDFILGPRDLVYIIQDNFLMVTTYDQYLERGGEIVVYDCRDLIEREKSKTNSQEVIDQQLGGGEYGGSSSLTMERSSMPSTQDETRLIGVIQAAIRDADCPWDDGTAVDPNTGSITAFKGYLVVQTLPGIHERVEELLEKLREKMDQ
ncbi:MAG: hypothetical protein HUJ26_13865 [Planctomycetaceae bacterium]|nr:hypothetical protein [Planctomycetaceae bacterium]